MSGLQSGADEEVGLRLGAVLDVQDGDLLGDQGAALGPRRQGRHFRRLQVRRQRRQVPSAVQLLPLIEWPKRRLF